MFVSQIMISLVVTSPHLIAARQHCFLSPFSFFSVASMIESGISKSLASFFHKQPTFSFSATTEHTLSLGGCSTNALANKDKLQLKRTKYFPHCSTTHRCQKRGLNSFTHVTSNSDKTLKWPRENKRYGQICTMIKR